MTIAAGGVLGRDAPGTIGHWLGREARHLRKAHRKGVAAFLRPREKAPHLVLEAHRSAKSRSLAGEPRSTSARSRASSTVPKAYPPAVSGLPESLRSSG
jgi:hypothetical protein